METIYYEWLWDSNVLFPTYHTEAFEATIVRLKKLTAILIDNINAVEAEAMAKSLSGNETVQEFYNDI